MQVYETHSLKRDPSERQSLLTRTNMKPANFISQGLRTQVAWLKYQSYGLSVGAISPESPIM